MFFRIHFGKTYAISRGESPEKNNTLFFSAAKEGKYHLFKKF